MISAETFHDRRRDPRLEKNIPVKICYEDADVVTETRNLSRSGVYCRIENYIEPMTKLKIQLLLPFNKGGKPTTKKIDCKGVIVRTEAIPDQEGFNVAIFFNDIKKREAEWLSEYVKSTLDRQPPA